MRTEYRLTFSHPMGTIVRIEIGLQNMFHLLRLLDGKNGYRCIIVEYRNNKDTWRLYLNDYYLYLEDRN